MKEIEKTVKLFVAFDGAEFDSAAKCREHEKTHGDSALVGLTAEQVTAAVAGDLQEIGDAIERAARKIAAARIAKGGRKRKAKAQEPPHPTPLPDDRGAFADGAAP